MIFRGGGSSVCNDYDNSEGSGCGGDNDFHDGGYGANEGGYLKFLEVVACSFTGEDSGCSGIDAFMKPTTITTHPQSYPHIPIAQWIKVYAL